MREDDGKATSEFRKKDVDSRAEWNVNAIGGNNNGRKTAMRTTMPVFKRG